MLSQSWKNDHFLRVPKIILHFGGTNNIFTDCNLIYSKSSVFYVKGVTSYVYGINSDQIVPTNHNSEDRVGDNSVEFKNDISTQNIKRNTSDINNTNSSNDDCNLYSNDCSTSKNNSRNKDNLIF